MLQRCRPISQHEMIGSSLPQCKSVNLNVNMAFVFEIHKKEVV